MTQIFLDVVLPNGVVLDASIFDDRNYVEINDLWLAKAEIEATKRLNTQDSKSHTRDTRN